MHYRLLATGFAAIASGITTVVYLNFSARVMPSLSRMPDAAGIAKMQSFNRTAVQPPFMICFFGAAVVSGYLVVRCARGHRTRVEVVAAAAGALYLAGVILTVAYNVPLNDKLAKVRADDPAVVGMWRDYLTNWTRANSVRAVLSGVSTALFVGAVIGMLGQDRIGAQSSPDDPTLTPTVRRGV